jgi:L-asparaginase II
MYVGCILKIIIEPLANVDAIKDIDPSELECGAHVPTATTANTSTNTTTAYTTANTTTNPSMARITLSD